MQMFFYQNDARKNQNWLVGRKTPQIYTVIIISYYIQLLSEFPLLIAGWFALCGCSTNIPQLEKCVFTPVTSTCESLTCSFGSSCGHRYNEPECLSIDQTSRWVLAPLGPVCVWGGVPMPVCACCTFLSCISLKAVKGIRGCNHSLAKCRLNQTVFISVQRRYSIHTLSIKRQQMIYCLQSAGLACAEEHISSCRVTGTLGTHSSESCNYCDVTMLPTVKLTFL